MDKILAFLKEKRDIAYVTIIAGIVATAVAGWNRYWDAQTVIEAYQQKTEKLEKALTTRDKSVIEKVIVYKYLDGQVIEKTETESVQRDIDTAEKTKSATDITLPNKKEKPFFAGASYDFFTKDLYVTGGVCLWDTINLYAEYPINFEVYEIRLRIGTTVRF